MRYSRQRELIFNILNNTTVHPTAQWIYEQARRSEPKISLGTVYRNLGEMQQRNEVRVIKTHDMETHYDARMTTHNHFVCKCCNCIYDIFEPVAVGESICGHRVDSVDVVYFGKCSECLNSGLNKNDKDGSSEP